MDGALLIYVEQVQKNDQNVGSATKDDSPSLSALIATLVPVLVVAGVMVTIFLVLRNRFKRNYQPRSYVGSLRPQ